MTEKLQPKEPSLHWSIRLALILGVLGLTLAACNYPEAETVPTTLATEPNPTSTLAAIPEATPTQAEKVETIAEVLESFKVGPVDFTKPHSAIIPNEVWKLFAKNKSGIDKYGDHTLLATEPWPLLGSSWNDPLNYEAEDALFLNSYTAWLPTDPTQPWHVAQIIDSTTPGQFASFNHAYWKKSLGEIGYYSSTASAETQADLIGNVINFFNADNPADILPGTIAAITTISDSQYYQEEAWPKGPAGNIQADLRVLGVPGEILDNSNSNLVYYHVISCSPGPDGIYNPLSPGDNSKYRAIISFVFDLTPQLLP